MSRFLSFLKVIGCIALLCFMVPIKFNDSDVSVEEFKDYLKRFNKTYTNQTEFDLRLKVFQNALMQIEKLNANRTSSRSALYGLTRFSDLTPDEFMNRHLLSKIGKRVSARQLNSDSAEDDSASNEIHRRSISEKKQKVDWRKEGVITKVKNQKQCGACWAFCVIEDLESMVALKYNKTEKLELSVQEVIDCAGYGNEGCNGGDMCTLLFWMQDNKIKIATEEEYPLKLENGQCKAKKNQSGFQVLKFVCNNVVGHEDYLIEALSRIGPAAAAVNALLWQNYLGGVIQYHCDGSMDMLNHAVQIVGYDLTAEIPHYIVRNSWGTEFGDNGYLYIAIGKNLCGIANEVTTLLDVS